MIVTMIMGGEDVKFYNFLTCIFSRAVQGIAGIKQMIENKIIDNCIMRNRWPRKMGLKGKSGHQA